MDMSTVLFDADLLRGVAADARGAVAGLGVQGPVIGADADYEQASTDAVQERLAELSAGTDLWELQWCFLVVMYLSDPLATAVHHATPARVFRPWFDGDPARKLAPFRQRMELHLAGKYEDKKMRGSRKMVEVDAKTPLEIVVHEVLLLHTLCGQGLSV